MIKGRTMHKKFGSILLLGAGVALGATAMQLGIAGASSDASLHTRCPGLTAGAGAHSAQQTSAHSALSSRSLTTRRMPSSHGSAFVAGDTNSGGASSDTGTTGNSSSIDINGSSASPASGSSANVSASSDSNASTTDGSGSLIDINGNTTAGGASPAAGGSGSGGVHIVVPKPQPPSLNLSGGLSSAIG
jgi:hypothetical protein